MLSIEDDFQVIGLPGNENENYLVKTTQGAIVIKKVRGHTVNDVETEAVYRHYLAKAGFPVIPNTKLGQSSAFVVDQDIFVATPYQPGSMATVTGSLIADAA